MIKEVKIKNPESRETFLTSKLIYFPLFASKKSFWWKNITLLWFDVPQERSKIVFGQRKNLLLEIFPNSSNIKLDCPQAARQNILYMEISRVAPTWVTRSGTYFLVIDKVAEIEVNKSSTRLGLKSWPLNHKAHYKCCSSYRIYIFKANFLSQSYSITVFKNWVYLCT